MSAAAIRWNPGDSAGERTLYGVNQVATFNGARPSPSPIGEAAIAVGDGVGYRYTHRTDYKTGQLALPVAYSDWSLVEEFLEWANNFGPFSMDTGDSEDNSYEDLQIAPDTEAECLEPDPETLDLTIVFTPLNIAAVPIPLRFQY